MASSHARSGCLGGVATTECRRQPALLRAWPDRLGGGEHLARRRVVARVLGQMCVADRPVGGHDDHAAELRGVTLDPSLVDDDAPEAKPRQDSVLEPARDDPGGEELTERCDLRSGERVGAPVGIDKQREVDSLDSSELRGVSRGTHADDGETHSGLVELLAGAVQLHRVLATKHSAVVAEEDQRHRALAPQVAEPHIPARVVLQDHVLEVARVDRGMCPLPDLYRVKHDSRLPFRLEAERAFAGAVYVPARAGS
jgi:hypothetical protein